jgi:C4-type Zn-finger protein
MAENILNLEHLHELVEQELDNAIKFIEREKKKRARNDKIRKKLEKQANEIGMTLKPREPLPVAAK